MTALLGRLLAPVWQWLAVAGAVLGALLVARQSGKSAARAEANVEMLKKVETRNEVDRAVAREPDPADRLRERWTRD